MDSFKERLQLISELSKLDLPMVFKGCTVLRAIAPHLGVGMRLETNDLDIDWAEGVPEVQFLHSILGEAVRHINPAYSVILVRELGVGRAAGFAVLGENKDVVFRVDICVRKSPFKCQYDVPDCGKFVGVAPQRMLVDKVSVVSRRTVLRRVKDIYDLFVLSYMEGFCLPEIYGMYDSLDISLGDFIEFKDRLQDLRHGYEKLKGIERKPSFDIVYDKACDLVNPFMTGCHDGLFWNGYAWVSEG